jgi:purine nucleosidase
MGGYPFPPRQGFPQWGPNLDYNIQADPDSGHYVLAEASPILVPLAITVETALRGADLEPLQKAGSVARLIAHQASHWLELEPQNVELARTYPALPAEFINFQHDPLACAVAGGWGGVTIETMPLLLEHQDGWVVERLDPTAKPFRVVTTVQAEKFRTFWLDMLTRP